MAQIGGGGLAHSQIQTWEHFVRGGGGSGKMFPIPNKKKEKSVWLLPLPPSGPPPPLGEIVKKIFPILNLISSPFD